MQHLTQAVIALALAIFAAPSPVRAAEKPNIIFILADDLGYGQLSCFGSKQVATPHLDRMASQGMRWTQFYAGSPVCAPSRSVLMTGKHTGHTRVRGNAGKKNRAAQSLRDEDITVAEVLKGVGYSTALIGKWGLGIEGGPGAPTRQGFDTFYGYMDQHHAHNPYPEFLVQNDTRVALRNRLLPVQDPAHEPTGAGIAAEPLDYAPDLIADQALDWVRTQKEKPFFLYWSLITPHANNEGTKAGRGQEVPDLGDYKDKPWPAPDRAHAATIQRLDRDIGRLFDLLRELNLDEKTLVIFTSDNGAHREGGNNPELFQASGPYRGIKRALYEGGIRVPTIMRWPGKIPAASEHAHAAYFGDVMSTLAELSGAALPPGLDSTSLLPAMLGRAPVPAPSRETYYWEFHENGFTQAALHQGRWKAIRNQTPDAPLELYDLTSDPAETTNIAAAHPEMTTRLAEFLKTERQATDDWPILPAKNAVKK